MSRAGALSSRSAAGQSRSSSSRSSSYVTVTGRALRVREECGLANLRSRVVAWPCALRVHEAADASLLSVAARVERLRKPVDLARPTETNASNRVRVYVSDGPRPCNAESWAVPFHVERRRHCGAIAQQRVAPGPRLAVASKRSVTPSSRHRARALRCPWAMPRAKRACGSWTSAQHSLGIRVRARRIRLSGRTPPDFRALRRHECRTDSRPLSTSLARRPNTNRGVSLL